MRMRSSSDVDDAILPHLTYQTPYVPLLLSASITTLLLSIPLVYLISFRLAALAIGLHPSFFTHPFTRSTLLPAIGTIIISPFRKVAFSWFHRVPDDDKLEDKHRRAELRRVEVFENERWNPHSREPSGSTAPGLTGSSFIGSPPLVREVGSAADHGGEFFFRVRHSVEKCALTR